MKFGMWPSPTNDDHGASLRRMIDLYKASSSRKINSRKRKIQTLDSSHHDDTIVNVEENNFINVDQKVLISIRFYTKVGLFFLL